MCVCVPVSVAVKGSVWVCTKDTTDTLLTDCVHVSCVCTVRSASWDAVSDIIAACDAAAETALSEADCPGACFPQRT